MKVRVDLSYLGSSYAGWQLQPESKTVQGELEKALLVYVKSLVREHSLEFEPERIPVMGSSRTDSGVHADAQVASFTWPDVVPVDLGKLRMALNGITESDIHVASVSKASDDFDARHSSQRKQYTYRLGISPQRLPSNYLRSWSIHQPLNIVQMIEEASCLCGRHDFSSFRASDCGASTTERVLIRSEFSRVSPSELRYVVQGNGFLKQMVRIIVGTLVEVGLGKRQSGSMEAILKAKDRRQAGPTAPAQGLTLDWVNY